MPILQNEEKWRKKEIRYLKLFVDLGRVSNSMNTFTAIIKPLISLYNSMGGWRKWGKAELSVPLGHLLTQDSHIIRMNQFWGIPQKKKVSYENSRGPNSNLIHHSLVHGFWKKIELTISGKIIIAIRKSDKIKKEVYAKISVGIFREHEWVSMKRYSSQV